MNFGQILELIISKTLQKVEREMKQDPSKIPELLTKLSKIAVTLQDNTYAEEIVKLANNISQSNFMKNRFLKSINEIGLYFEAPNFTTFNLNNLLSQLKNDFDVDDVEPVLIKKELVEFMNDKLQVSMPIPKNDIILEDILVGSVYTIKVKQEAFSKTTARDFGTYKSSIGLLPS